MGHEFAFAPFSLLWIAREERGSEGIHGDLEAIRLAGGRFEFADDQAGERR